MSPSSWFETRGIADAVLEVVFDADRKGDFVKPFHPHGQWFAVPVMPVLPSPHAWDCRLILDDLEPTPGVTYRLDAFFLSPETAQLALPAGSKFTVFPGRVVGHGTVVQWL